MGGYHRSCRLERRRRVRTYEARTSAIHTNATAKTMIAPMPCTKNSLSAVVGSTTTSSPSSLSTCTRTIPVDDELPMLVDDAAVRSERRMVDTAGAYAGLDDVDRNVEDDEPLPQLKPPNEPPVRWASADGANRTTARNAEMYLADAESPVFIARLYQTCR